jgi:hypothetical protein
MRDHARMGAPTGRSLAGRRSREGIVNNLVYGNQQPDKIAASVEEIVRKDVGAAGPITYRIVAGDAAATSVASVLADVGHALGSGATTLLLTVELDLPGSRPATLTARILRQGVGCYCGSLLFAVTLGRPTSDEATIEDHKSFGTPRFLGGAAAGRLNAAKDLAKRVDKVLRTEAEMGSIKVRAPRLFRVMPGETGAVLVLGTLPRLTSMGMGATTDAREVLEIAGAVEAAL